jgi:hypothetical protein
MADIPETFSSDPDGIAAAVAELQARREWQGEAEPLPPEEPQPEGEPPVKLEDTADAPLSAREAADRTQQLREMRRDEENRAADYQAVAEQQQIQQAREAAAQQQAQVEAQQQAAQQQDDAVQQHIANVGQQAQQIAWAAQAGEATVLQAANELRQAFPEAGDPAQVARMAQTNPQRYALYVHNVAAIQAGVARVQDLHQRYSLVAHEHNQHVTTQYQRWAASEDAAFSAEFPEFADGAKAPALQRAALDALKQLGFSDDEIAHGWNESGVLRDRRTQKLVALQVRQNQARAAMSNGRYKNLPPVQRPGVSEPRGQGDLDQIASVTRQLGKASGTEAMRLAVRLTALKREAGQL